MHDGFRSNRHQHPPLHCRHSAKGTSLKYKDAIDVRDDGRALGLQLPHLAQVSRDIVNAVRWNTKFEAVLANANDGDKPTIEKLTAQVCNRHLQRQLFHTGSTFPPPMHGCTAEDCRCM